MNWQSVFRFRCPHWIGSTSWFICCLLASLVAGLWLSGCASFSTVHRWEAPAGYWVKIREARPVSVIQEVEDPSIICTGRPAQADVQVNGCFFWATGLVVLRRGLDPEHLACVLSHEGTGKFSHAQGWDHPGSESTTHIDCGDGTMITHYAYRLAP